MVLPRDEAARDRGDLRVRARGRRHRRRRPARRTRSARGSRSCARRSTRRRRPSAMVDRARRRARALRDSARARSHALVDGGLQDLEQTRYADFDELRGYCEKVAGAVGVACVAGVRLGRRRARDDARHRAAADQHHPRRRRGLAARPRLPPAGRARRAFGVDGRSRRRPQFRGVVDGVPGRSARARISRRGCACSTRSTAAARSASATFAGLYRAHARPDRGERLRRLRRQAAALDAARSSRVVARGAAAVKVAVVGGGLAGLAAALELVDAGARRRRSTRRGRRSAAPCRRCPSARAIPSRRPTTASTSRSAASRSTCASSTGSARAARICGRGSRCR